jgi:hypothetical protein
MYVSFYTNSLLQGWQMTRILTIIALLFATPAWAEDIEINPKKLSEQMLFDTEERYALRFRKLDVQNEEIKKRCGSFSRLPTEWIEEFSQEHKINPSSVVLKEAKISRNGVFRDQCVVTVYSDIGACEHRLIFSSRTPIVLEGISNVECK